VLRLTPPRLLAPLAITGRTVVSFEDSALSHPALRSGRDKALYGAALQPARVPASTCVPAPKKLCRNLGMRAIRVCRRRACVHGATYASNL
jgi:hypothetical protein